MWSGFNVFLTQVLRFSVSNDMETVPSHGYPVLL